MKRIRVAALAAAVLALAACSDSPSGAGRRDPVRDQALSDAIAGLNSPNFAKSGTAGVVEPTVIRFRSVEDPAFPADPAVCAAAPFGANVLLGASLWSEKSKGQSGEVTRDDFKRIGRATACVQITDPNFPPGLAQKFYAKFDLPEGSFTAVGACTLISNDVPTAGLVLGGCHLAITGAPASSAGGAVTSLSVFNPRRLPGFSTGSEWTLQSYPR
ncbi:MAG TPA: hypothetical protein VFQ39_01760 [Longimicrobium sp.]|nr:hypothetical protein [Longimicrobium sp.]